MYVHCVKILIELAINPTCCDLGTNGLCRMCTIKSFNEKIFGGANRVIAQFTPKVFLMKFNHL